MIRTSLFLFLSFFTGNLFSQHFIEFTILDSLTKEPIVGATVFVEELSKGSAADLNGKCKIENMPDGTFTFQIKSVGYLTVTETYKIPIRKSDMLILLVASAEELDEIIVEGTRSNRSIDDIPTRVEVLTEEIDEASTMDPSKVAHLLTHSTGIQVQQTSATSNSANVRIQGLDGRYTQILKDGFPIYGGFSGSLSIMQIPPLDLRQIEYIKGSASTLFGAGAISGLINLLSKEPMKDKDEVLLHLNASQVGAFDINVFTSSRKGKLGYTLLAQKNSHQFFDADDDGFSDLPQLTKYNLNPRLFFYLNEKNKFYVGATITNEERVGGDLIAIKSRTMDSSHFYQENNDVNRLTTQIKYEHKINDKSELIFRNSFNFFNRELIMVPSYLSINYFAGEQISSFSEISFSHRNNKNSFISGINFYSDEFKETSVYTPGLRNEKLITTGAFVNYTFDLGKKISFESGLRGDYTIDNDFHLLPRLSVLFKWTEKLTTRIGGGSGYRNASIFNQEAEILGYRNVSAINYDNVNAEKSQGGNIDIGYKTTLGKHFFININQMFFATRIDNTLKLVSFSQVTTSYHFENMDGYTQTYGGETFFKFGFYDFVLFVGYTYTKASHHFGDSVSVMTLTPQHSLKGDLLYALPGKWRIGADYEYKSSQTLSSGRVTPAFWTYGLVIEYTKNQFTLFGNVENYTNVRQTKYESLNSVPYNTPQFTEVWAPLDGIVVNVGIKIKL